MSCSLRRRRKTGNISHIPRKKIFYVPFSDQKHFCPFDFLIANDPFMRRALAFVNGPASPPPSLPPPLSLIERERGVKRGGREEGRRAPTPPLFVPLLRPVSRSPRSVLARAPTEEEQSVRGGRGDRAHVCVCGKRENSFRDVPAFAGSQRGYFNGYLWGYLCCVDFRHFDVRVWIERVNSGPIPTRPKLLLENSSTEVGREKSNYTRSHAQKKGL